MNKEPRRLLEQHFDTAFDTPDGIKKLRELILTLAMQGKLVPQDPDDQPASELLKEIAAEKARLIKAGKLKPQKPLPPINPVEVPFTIPKNWQWSCLGVISLDSDSGWSPQCLQISRSGENEWGVLKVSAVSWGKFKPEENKSLPHKFSPKPEYEVKAGDFLLSRANTEELVARSVIVEQCPPKLIMSDKIVRFSLPEKVDKRFINIANCSSYARSFYQDHASGTSSSMKNVTRAAMCELPIPIPPLNEQKRIVARIEQLMARCDGLDRLRAARDKKRLDTHAAALTQLLSAPDSENFSTAWKFIASNFDELYSVRENVTELRKAILQLAVMGKLVPQDPDDQPASELLKEIAAEKARLIKAGKLKLSGKKSTSSMNKAMENVPSGWISLPLSELGFFFGGKTPSTNKSNFWNGLIPWVSAKDMKSDFILDSEDHITEEGLNSGLTLIPPNSVLMVVRSGILRRTFPVAINMVPCTINQDLKALIPFADSYANYLIIMLKGFESFILTKLAKKGMTVESIVFDEFASALFPFPPIAEQKRIVARVEQLMALCDKLEQCIAAAGESRTTILNAMLAKV